MQKFCYCRLKWEGIVFKYSIVLTRSVIGIVSKRYLIVSSSSSNKGMSRLGLEVIAHTIGYLLSEAFIIHCGGNNPFLCSFFEQKGSFYVRVASTCEFSYLFVFLLLSSRTYRRNLSLNTPNAPNYWKFNNQIISNNNKNKMINAQLLIR